MRIIDLKETVPEDNGADAALLRGSLKQAMGGVAVEHLSRLIRDPNDAVTKTEMLTTLVCRASV